jgi:hypothetical protein
MTLKFLALQGAPYTYDISRLRVKLRTDNVYVYKAVHMYQCSVSRVFLGKDGIFILGAGSPLVTEKQIF